VSANVGGTTGVGVGVGVGDGTLAGTPGTPGTPGTLGVSLVAQMSSSQLIRMKKRCVDVLGSGGTYDRDLRELCLLIARR
ncbi:MAG: hypothetical protein E5Y58_33500, partial [Mesorhizobium sp.]